MKDWVHFPMSGDPVHIDDLLVVDRDNCSRTQHFRELILLLKPVPPAAQAS